MEKIKRDLDFAMVHRQPRRVPSGKYVIGTGPLNQDRHGYLVLADAHGRLTPAGKYYFKKNPEAQRPNAHYDPNQATIRKGDGDYIKTRAGEQRVRAIQPDGSMKVTKLGRSYYQGQHDEFLVEVPCDIAVTDSKGRPRTRKATVPVNTLGLGRIMASRALSAAQQVAAVKTETLRQLGGYRSRRTGALVLKEISGQTYTYDPQGEWLISNLSTDSHGHTTATMHQPLREYAEDNAPLVHHALDQGGHLRGFGAAHLPHPVDCYLPEAFEEHPDCLCVPRQLAVLLRQPMAKIIESFDEILEEGWQQKGVRPQEVERWCVLHNHPYFLVRCGRLVKVVEPTGEKKNRAIAYAVFDYHAYFYKSARTVSQWNVSQTVEASAVLRRESRSTHPEYSEWKTYHEPAPGYYFTSDLNSVRRRLLESGRNPKISLQGGSAIMSLSYECTEQKDGAKGLMFVKQAVEDEDRILEWLERLPKKVEWCGEKLPALTQKVLFELLRAERRNCPVHLRKEILKTQGGNCNICGWALESDDIEWDHLAPLQQMCQGMQPRFQAICNGCHEQKTSEEGRQDRSLESRFSLPVWNDYAMAPRPPPLVFKAHEWGEEGECLEVDVRRCRRNAIMYSAHPFSVFCPLDSIVPAVEGELADFSFVDLRSSKKSALSLLPFVGRGWYHRVAVEWMLHTGVCRWQDLIFSLTSTGKIPVQCLAEPLKQMEDAWGEHDDLAKFSINAMIGLWAIDNTTIFHVKVSRDPVEGAGCWGSRHVEYEGGSTTDWIFANKLLTNGSMVPIHTQILQTEHVRIAQLLFAIKSLSVPLRCVKQLKTDCVLLKDFPNKRREALMDLGKLTFADLPRLRTQFAGEKGQQFLDCYAEIRGNSEKVEVFRLGAGRSLQGQTYQRPWRESSRPADRQPWKDLTEAEAMECVLEGRGLLLCGSPGVGKTHWLRNAILALREAGKRTDVVAKTHAAVQNIGAEAVTADHYCHKYIKNGTPSCHTLVVEELTQINVQIWADLSLCRFKGISFICAGDPGRQFPPVCESWAGCPVQEDLLEKSDMLYEMCGGNRFTLTENKRSDGKLFDFYTGLGQYADVQEALRVARQLFPASKKPADFTLTMSHGRRIIINKQRNLEEYLDRHRSGQQPDAAFLKAPVSSKRAGNRPQSMWVWPGLLLIGGGSHAKKGLFYKISEITDDQVAFECGLKLTREQTVTSMRLCWSLTFASCQGLSLRGRLRLETQSPNFTMRHLYVGISRGTSAELVEVC